MAGSSQYIASWHHIEHHILRRYRTLADRLLTMRLVPTQRITSRDVSYEFMNRQMVWHAFTVSLDPVALFQLGSNVIFRNFCFSSSR